MSYENLNKAYKKIETSFIDKLHQNGFSFIFNDETMKGDVANAVRWSNEAVNTVKSFIKKSIPETTSEYEIAGYRFRFNSPNGQSPWVLCDKQVIDRLRNSINIEIEEVYSKLKQEEVEKPEPLTSFQAVLNKLKPIVSTENKPGKFLFYSCFLTKYECLRFSVNPLDLTKTGHVRYEPIRSLFDKYNNKITIVIDKKKFTSFDAVVEYVESKFPSFEQKVLFNGLFTLHVGEVTYTYDPTDTGYGYLINHIKHYANIITDKTIKIVVGTESNGFTIVCDNFNTKVEKLIDVLDKYKTQLISQQGIKDENMKIHIRF